MYACMYAHTHSLSIYLSLSISLSIYLFLTHTPCCSLFEKNLGHLGSLTTPRFASQQNNTMTSNHFSNLRRHSPCGQLGLRCLYDEETHSE